MELSPALLLRRRNVPFQLYSFPRRRDAVGIRRRRRLPGRCHHHARAVYVETHFLAALQLIAQSHLDAIALVSADHQWLNPLTLQTIVYRTWIVPLFFTRLPVSRLLIADFLDIFRQHVHVTRIEIEPLIQRNLDIDCRDIVLSDRRRRRATAPRR